MRTLTKETCQILKFNQKNALLFEVLYRLLTGPFYLFLLNRGLKWSLKMAGYSYLTAANIGYFLLKPGTILMIILIGIIGILFLALETGCLLTLFQGAAYFRKLDMGEILAGGFSMLGDELKKKNWQLGLLILANYGIANLYLIYRVLTHVKPLNFVMSELMKQNTGRLAVCAGVVLIVLAVVPGLYTFYACMIEQKNFRDGYRRSRRLLKGHAIRTVTLLGGYYIGLILLLYVVYFFCILVAAVGMSLFTDNRLALAILPAVGDRIELILIFLGSIVLALGNFAALSVQYYQYSNRLSREPRWDFSYPPRKSFRGRMVGASVAVAAAVSLFFLFDLVRNGSAITDDILMEVQITAHRGSSKTAPENTMAAMERAVEDMADFVEIDVQETADGVVVLGHDSTLKRVAGVNRAISSYTLEELAEIDVGTWFSKEYEGETIPTLVEVMEFCKGRVKMNIEIKNLGKDSLLPDKVVELITEYQMKEQCVVTSTRLSYLSRVKELDPDIRTGYIISAAYGDYYSSDDVDFISIRSSFVNGKLVEAAHEKGKAIHAWTVNNKSEMERMKMLGVDNIITDYPVLAREIVYRERATETLFEYLRLVLK